MKRKHRQKYRIQCSHTNTLQLKKQLHSERSGASRILRKANLHIHLCSLCKIVGARGGLVVKALRYKPAGRGFDSRWCHWNFSVTSFRSHGVFPGDKGGRCVRLTTLPPSCAVVMKYGEINFLEPSGPLQACKRDCFIFI